MPQDIHTMYRMEGEEKTMKKENTMKEYEDKELYTELVRQLDHLEEYKQRYQDLEAKTTRRITEILELPLGTATLEIIPPYTGEHADYVHELTITTVQLPVTITLESLCQLNTFVESHDMEIHHHRDKLVITYTQDLDWLTSTPPLTTDDDDEEEKHKGKRNPEDELLL